jgi:hypothetical protein
MNKQEFLENLTEEQLNLLGAITDKDVTQELKKRNLKTPIEVKVGDCFIYRNDYDDIYLTKVMNHTPDFYGQYFGCEEISIDSHDVDSYEVNYHIDDFSEHDRIDSEIFNKIAASVDTRDNAIGKVCEEFDNQIRELCSTLLNTQNKN